MRMADTPLPVRCALGTHGVPYREGWLHTIIATPPCVTRCMRMVNLTERGVGVSIVQADKLEKLGTDALMKMLTSVTDQHPTILRLSCVRCSLSGDHTPAINEGCTRSLRISNTSRQDPLQPVPKTQVPCTPYHPPNIAGV
jgi:hypothetical protein